MKQVRLIFIFAVFAVLALGVLIAVLLGRIGTLSERVDIRTSSLVQEIRSNNAQAEGLTQNLLRLAQDVNEIRRSLGLSVASYAIGSPDGEQSVEDAAADEHALYFEAVDVLLERSRRQAFGALVQELSSSALFTGSAPLIAIERLDSYEAAVRWDGYDVFMLSLNPRTKLLKLTSTGTGATTEVDGAGEALSAIESTLGAERRRVEAVKTMEQRLFGLLSDTELRRILNAKFLVLGGDPESGAGELTVRRGGHVFFSIGVDSSSAAFRVDDETVGSFDALYERIKERVAVLDPRTPEEKAVERIVADIEALAATEAFTAYLGNKNGGLRLVREPREDGDYYYFDLLDRDRHRIGAFGVLKQQGEVYLMDGDDVPLASLRALHTVNPNVKKN